MPDRYLKIWADAFAHALPPATADLTEEQASAAVREAEEAAREAVRSFAVLTLLGEAASTEADLARDRQREERARRERSRIEKDAAKAWRSLYGPDLADRLEAWTEYSIVEVVGHVLAVRLDQLAEVTAAVRSGAPGTVLQDTGRRSVGWRIGRVAEHLDAVDPTPAEAAELIAATARQQEQEATARRTRQAEAAQAERDRREQLRNYGTELPAA
jgi:hypothetical protein